MSADRADPPLYPPAPPGEARADPSQGEPGRAFEELYQRVAPAVFSWASLHVREPLRARLDPEDVLQEVACRAYERFGDYDPARSEFRAWVFGIARNVLYQALQRLGSGVRASHGELLTTGRLLSLPDSATSISKRVARDETLAAFLRHVGQLPDEERQLLLYRGLEGLPHEEVARLMGLSAEAAAKRWGRLRERLRSEAGAGEFVAA